MALPFVYREEAPARQAIAQLQLEAAAAENASRERIAKEQTASQRYVTQSQLADREKDRALRSEDLKLRREYDIANAKLDADDTRDAATKERAKLQFATILQSVNSNAGDPPTQRELEATLSGAADLTEDQRKAVRSIHADVVKEAKSNFAMGQRIANNYKAELKGKAATDPALPEIYNRISKDPNVIFDRATGNVESAFRAPREEAAPVPGSGVLRLPGGAAVPPTTGAAPAAPGAVPTIADMRARITGAPAGVPVDTSGIGNAVPVPVAPAVTASDLPPPSMFNLIGPAAPRDPMQGPMQRFRMPGGFGTPPRASELAPPPAAPVSPPSFSLPSSPMGAVDRWMRGMTPQEPIGPLPPRYGPEEPMQGPMDNPMRGLPPAVRPLPAAPSRMHQLLRMLPNMPEFARLPGPEQQAILDEITGGATDMPAFPRAYDLNGLRREYVPMDPYLAPQ